jgi:hypothetical protein
MLIEASFWKAFHEAKSALLKALHAPHTQRPVFATPQSRESIRASTVELISLVTEAEHELKTIQDEFAATQALLSRTRATATNLLSPIGALPPELIHMIVMCASEASNPLHILRMSHVSKTWRETVISDPKLFTCADWDHWPCSLVKLWCIRAGSQPLTIRLNHNAMCEIANHKGSKLHDILTSYIPRLGQLRIHGGSFPLEYDLMQHILDIFSSKPAPLLTHMSIYTDDPLDSDRDHDREFQVEPDAMPALCVLDLGNSIGPVYLGLPPDLKVFAFSVSNNTEWYQWRSMLRNLPNLEDLRIKVSSDLHEIPPYARQCVYEALVSQNLPTASSSI